MHHEMASNLFRDPSSRFKHEPTMQTVALRIFRELPVIVTAGIAFADSFSLCDS